MRIGLVVPGFSVDDRDWCIPALRDLACTLARTDEVRVIAIRYPYQRKRYRVDGIETIALGGGLSHGGATLRLWRDAINMLRREHRSQSFDVLHAFWATESGLLAALAGRLLGVPTLVSLAGGELVALRDIGYGDQRLAWERVKVAASLRLANAASAGSRLLREKAKRHLGQGRKVHLAPLGVDVQRFAPGPEAPSHNGLVHVAGLTPVKDQMTLLRAFAEVRACVPGASLEICGNGPLRNQLESVARDLKVEAGVHFRGEVDHACLPAAYRGAAAFVLSSRHEAQSMASLEAASCGVPVVGTRVGILPEITSALAPVGSAAALAAAMLFQLRAPEPTVDVTERIRSQFSLETCTERFRRLYAELM